MAPPDAFAAVAGRVLIPEARTFPGAATNSSRRIYRKDAERLLKSLDKSKKLALAPMKSALPPLPKLSPMANFSKSKTLVATRRRTWSSTSEATV